MGIRPSSFKGGGGFLNNVDVTFVGYAFQARTFTAKSGENKGEDFTPLNIELVFQVEGAAEPVKTWLRMGLADNWGAISADGKQLGTPDGQSLGRNSQLGVFVTSLVNAGFPESSLDDSPDHLSLEAVIGGRMRLIQEVNEEKTAKFGKQKNKKTGQEYDRKDLKVEKFYGFSGTSAGASTKKATNGSGKALTGGGADLGETAATTLSAILADNGGEIGRAKLPVKIAQKLGAKHPQREELRKLMYSEEFLAGSDAWMYESATQMITAV